MKTRSGFAKLSHQMNYGAIATGNRPVLIRCALQHLKGGGKVAAQDCATNINLTKGAIV